MLDQLSGDLLEYVSRYISDFDIVILSCLNRNIRQLLMGRDPTRKRIVHKSSIMKNAMSSISMHPHQTTSIGWMIDFMLFTVEEGDSNTDISKFRFNDMKKLTYDDKIVQIQLDDIPGHALTYQKTDRGKESYMKDPSKILSHRYNLMVEYIKIIKWKLKFENVQNSPKFKVDRRASFFVDQMPDRLFDGRGVKDHASISIIVQGMDMEYKGKHYLMFQVNQMNMNTGGWFNFQ